ncbi:YlbD family protein [Bacillus sp. CGMCC 1.16607]|uniref:YlbD family protein n=1 Tax=Bacillus sp. CGMCC 1.16607 TaxID=3351842 RepID=UPI003632F977
MTSKKQHPNVIKFKEFVMKHPKMTTEVRSGVVTWQELYEDWYLLGEDDPRWNEFKEGTVKKEMEETNTENKSDWMTQVFGYLKTMDINQIQQHINHVSQAIGAVQGVLSQFQAPSQSTARKEPNQPSHPFSFRKD